MLTRVGRVSAGSENALGYLGTMIVWIDFGGLLAWMGEDRQILRTSWFGATMIKWDFGAC